MTFLLQCAEYTELHFTACSHIHIRFMNGGTNLLLLFETHIYKSTIHTTAIHHVLPKNKMHVYIQYFLFLLFSQCNLIAAAKELAADLC